MTSLLQQAVERAGTVKGARAAEMVATWALAEASLGHELGAGEGGHLSAAIREYSRYWKQSERTTWRELNRFRQVFPEQESPAAYAAALRQHQANRPTRAGLADLPLAV